MDAGPIYKKPALAVRPSDAENVLRALHRAGLLDGSRKTAQTTEEVVIPVRDDPSLPTWAARFSARLLEGAALEAREERLSPHERVLARLAPDLRPFAPEKWELLGDVVVLRLAPDAPRPARIAAAYADVLGAKCVVRDLAGVAGELREMQAEILYGDDPETTHLENGVRFRLDASRIMFSSGNKHERARVVDAAGETVVDMFAGIGYFAIPLALRGGPTHVLAIEKNPLSFRYLEENVRLNRVERVVEPWLGDNREHPRAGFADRVLMGYFPETERFLPTALGYLKPAGGVVHFHNTAHERTWKDEMTRQFLNAARACGRVVAVQEARVVKSHSPGVVHAVLVARVTA